MLKPLEVEYKDRKVTLECTHKKSFPPPQMYGSTADDLDVMWRQGTLDQNQYQHLKTWQENCGLMVMGPKCLDCPLALKQNPRPGRPHVIETEAWLPVKDRYRWDDMAKNKAIIKSDPPAPIKPPEPQHISEMVGAVEEEEVVEETEEEPTPWTDKEIVGFKNIDTEGLLEEPEAEEEEPEAEEEEPEAEEEEPEEETDDLDSFIDGLAD